MEVRLRPYKNRWKKIVRDEICEKLCGLVASD
jgi:hypothetical protein